MKTVSLPGLMERLSPELQVKLNSITRKRSFPAGRLIFTQGAPPNTIYFIVNGQVKVARNTPDGHEIILCMPGAGDSFCPVTVLDGGPQLGGAVAITDVEIMYADRRDFLELCRERPELQAAVQQACLGEVRRMVQRLELLSFRTLKQRLASVIIHTSRHSPQACGKPTELRITQLELAQLAGSSRESTSRLLAKWERDGMLSLGRGRVIILQTEQLELLAR
jgi:CRP/FNR family transcriptional regulator